MDSYISLTSFLVYSYLAHLIHIFRIPPLKLFTFRTKYDEIGHSLQWRRETEVEDAKAKQERKPHSILRSKTASARSQWPSLYYFVQKLWGFRFFPSNFEICDWIDQNFQLILSCCCCLHKTWGVCIIIFVVLTWSGLDLLSFDEFFWEKKISWLMKIFIFRGTQVFSLNDNVQF